VRRFDAAKSITVASARRNPDLAELACFCR